MSKIKYWCNKCHQEHLFKDTTSRYEVKDVFFIEDTNPSDVVPRLTTVVLLLTDKDHPVSSTPCTVEYRITIPE